MTAPSAPTPPDGGRVLAYNGRPTTVPEALVEVAAWLDVADQFIDEAFARRGQVRPNPGDEVQRDLRRLADWFTANPDAALSAACYLLEASR